MNMKKITSLLAAVIAAAFCCSTANAQYSNALLNATLIYSNAFTGLSSVNITNSHPDFSSGLYGGSNGVNAAWMDLNGSAHTNYYYANGTLGSPQGGNVLLPFTPAANHVYALYITYTTSGTLNTWVAGGFGGYYADGAPSARSQFNSAGTAGYDWMLQNYNSSAQCFLGPAGVGTLTGPFNAVAGTSHSMLIILDSTSNENSSNMWSIAAYNDGQLTGKETYSVNTGGTAPVSIRGVGYGINGMTVDLEHNVTWNSLILSANQELIIQQPVSAAVNVGTGFTNSVLVGGTPPFGYQWYTNGVPLVNGGGISGANTNVLVISSTTAGNTSTNYYCVVTNLAYGAVTSAATSLTVYTNPVFLSAFPVAYTNPMTLFGGGNIMGTNYFGSTPTFSVLTAGGQPITYQWQTNGVNVGGATGASITFTNCQLSGSPTNFTCIASNSYAMTTNNWAVSYVQTPTAPFPSLVLSNQPAGFWRLNEGGDDGNGDNGAVATDYASGNNGLYTNAIFGYATYTTNIDSSAAAVRINFAGTPSDVFGVQGIDYSNKVNAVFTVQGWIKGVTAQPSGAPIIAKGYNGGEQFALDINGNKYRFLVRNAAGIASSVTAPTGLDNNWHFIVGVCDEANGVVSLYVDGLQAAASASITPGSGMFATTTPVTFGARGSSPLFYDNVQFSGYLSDLAVYNSALSSIQVANLYSAAGFSTSFTFVPPLPPTNYVFLANTTITIPATVFCPLGNNGFYWTNLTTGSVVASGTSSAPGNLNATLTIPAASPTLSGDLLELVVTNAANTTNWFVTLFSPAAPIALNYSSPILYSNFFNGGALSIGVVPVTAANLLVGGTNTMWNIVSNNPAAGYAAYGDGTLAANLNSVLLPFTPHSGYVYTLEASLTFTVTPPAGGWGGLGFSTQFPTNYVTDPRVLNQGWALLNMGANGGGALLNANGASQGGTPNLMTAVNTPYDIQVILDTTAPQWSVALYVAG
ncbi:MAG TPA: LamG-like jellyroll fold domain-containing protein, partial [Candidatus Sulfotelmatobacter sp.]|nr:LamG-like jellyroll fold domain-containing protein [Candidatus Sulfotelmatobacter sp.]